MRECLPNSERAQYSFREKVKAYTVLHYVDEGLLLSIKKGVTSLDELITPFSTTFFYFNCSFKTFTAFFICGSSLSILSRKACMIPIVVSPVTIPVGSKSCSF